MALLELKRDPTAREVRQFARVWLPAFCALLATWAVLRWQAWPTASALLAVAIAGIAIEAVRPGWMRALFLGWMWAAFPIGWLVSHLLMGAIYYLVITPIGLIMRAAGRDPLARRFEPDAETYWTRRDPPAEASRYFRQF
jgi:hypothetical protein